MKHYGNIHISSDLGLRPIGHGYAHEIFQNFTEQVVRFLAVKRPPDHIEGTRTFINLCKAQSAMGSDLVWVILFKKQFAGCCGIHNIPSGTPHFGLWIAEPLQGRGIGRSLVRFMLPWAVAHLDIDYVKYPVDVQNLRSRKLVEGMEVELAQVYKEGNQEIMEYRYSVSQHKGGIE